MSLAPSGCVVGLPDDWSEPVACSLRRLPRRLADRYNRVYSADTVILTCDRSLKWPTLIGIGGLGLLIGSVWVHFQFIFGLPPLIAALYSAMVRVDVVLSKKNATLEVQPTLVGFRLKTKTPVLRFSEIREVLVESEFELGGAADETGKGSKPFVWHLTAITDDGMHHRLTWHFVRRPVLTAGEEAARFPVSPFTAQFPAKVMRD